jgi:Asp-tRNA(Asn)/Glu-tRNA(Gln) amidotransferase A subunit family amidase
VLSIITGHDPHDPGSTDVPSRDYAADIDAPIASMVIGVPWRWLEEEAPCTPETRTALDAALAVFRELERIVSGATKANNLASLLPWAWKASQATAVVNH